MARPLLSRQWQRPSRRLHPSETEPGSLIPVFATNQLPTTERDRNEPAGVVERHRSTACLEVKWQRRGRRRGKPTFVTRLVQPDSGCGRRKKRASLVWFHFDFAIKIFITNVLFDLLHSPYAKTKRPRLRNESLIKLCSDDEEGQQC